MVGEYLNDRYDHGEDSRELTLEEAAYINLVLQLETAKRDNLTTSELTQKLEQAYDDLPTRSQQRVRIELDRLAANEP